LSLLFKYRNLKIAAEAAAAINRHCNAIKFLFMINFLIVIKMLMR